MVITVLAVAVQAYVLHREGVNPVSVRGLIVLGITVVASLLV
jgi:hypothetical protein